MTVRIQGIEDLVLKTDREFKEGLFGGARHWLDYEGYKAIWLRSETELEHSRNIHEGRISRPVTGGYQRALKRQLEREGID